MEKTGTFTMDRKKLFQLVGKANSNLADVILKVGLFDRYIKLDAGFGCMCCIMIILSFAHDGVCKKKKRKEFLIACV